MGRRPIVLFWGAVAAAVFFLGSAWAAAGRVGEGPHAPANAVVMAVAIVGLGATALVAGRIAFVVGQTQRQARTWPSGDPVDASGEES